MSGTEWASVVTLAAEKLTLLGALRNELDRFITAENIETDEVFAIFERTRPCMERIRQIDCLLAASSGMLHSEPELAQILDDQRALARKILKMTHTAYEKAELLTADCRAGLRGVQQKKWICAQFAAQPVAPGSLLDYSEKVGPARKK